MTRKPFDPKAFLNVEKEKEKEKVYNNNPGLKVIKSNPKPHAPATASGNVEYVVQQIEATGIDIAPDYDSWLKVGFAIADGFGEQGEGYFHSISKFHPKYDPKECQKQYKECLKGRKPGSVTISTLFHYAKSAGIDICPPAEKNVLRPVIGEPVTMEKELPELPNFIYEEHPGCLKDAVQSAHTPKEKDLLLLGSLTTISGCLPNVYGIYDQLTVYANLFLFVTAPASSGKGRVNLCKWLVDPIHKQKREESSSEKVRYEVELSEYHEQKKKDKTLEKPGKPVDKLLFIPANSSATGTFQLLANNEGSGLIFETEGDTLAQAFKSEHGNYSDGFRKAFHHEAISYYRRTDSEYVNIASPRVSAVLTGTPNQILSLMPDAENGLFSRFMFYKMDRQKQWRNVFEQRNREGLNVTFDRLGQRFLSFYQKLGTHPSGIEIYLSTQQSKKFHEYFSRQYDTFLFLKKGDLEASLLRLGLICFRIMMILTTVRMLESNTLDSRKECEFQDFEIALAIIKTLLMHTEEVFLLLPKSKRHLPRQKNRKELFLDELPEQFTTQQYRDIATYLKIHQKTAERYVGQLIDNGFLQRTSQGNYRNILKKEA